jgi:hypothetical protein
LPAEVARVLRSGHEVRVATLARSSVSVGLACLVPPAANKNACAMTE